MASLQGGPPASRRSTGRIIAAVVGLAIGTAVAGYAAFSAPSTKPKPSTLAKQPVNALHESMPTTPANYLGVYEDGSPASYTQVQQFGQAIGRQPNLALYYSSWGEAFQTTFAQEAQAEGATVIVDLDPTSVTLASIANGLDDAYVASLAGQILSFGHPVVVCFGHEMNGFWYSWGWKQQSPAEYVKAWRHIVGVFRKVGADNVTWLWTVSDVQPNDGPIKDYWPGASYVNWVGMDAYYYFKTDTFNSVFSQTMTDLRQVTSKPILISETAIGPGSGPSKISGLLAGIKQSGVLGFVWFDVTQTQPPYHQNWRLEDSKSALSAFKTGLQTYLK